MLLEEVRFEKKMLLEEAGFSRKVTFLLSAPGHCLTSFLL
jgi:hypothetical protein